MTPDSSSPVQSLLRSVIDSSPSGLLLVDGEGKIVLVNREVERLFGHSREELLAQPVDLLLPERFREGHAGFRAAFIRDPRARAMGAGRDLFGLHKSGTEIPIEIGLTPLVSEKGLFVLSSIVDISARKRAEARFRLAVESSPNGMVMVDPLGNIVLVNREVERMFGRRGDRHHGPGAAEPSRPGRGDPRAVAGRSPLGPPAACFPLSCRLNYRASTIYAHQGREG